MRIGELWKLYADRLRFAGALTASVLLLGAALRVLLFVSFQDGALRMPPLLLALGAGAVFDFQAAAIALLPVWLLLALFRWRLLALRPVRMLLLAAANGGLFFLSAMEYYFFEEFNARYNHIALDYLLYPKEVFVNIWDSYDVPLFVGFAAVAGVALAWPAGRLVRNAAFGPLPWAARWRAGAAVVLSAAVCAGAAFVLPAEVSEDRITSEIAQNGLGQLVRAFLTAHLDYDLYYLTLPAPEGRARAAKVLGFPATPLAAASTTAGGFELQRRFLPASSGGGRPWDVVVILEESLGSEFIGALGHPERGTSRAFDRWSSEGTLFTNLMATGNRTVRGLEATLCSFPPLPGDSIVKRKLSDDVASVARVLREQGFRTAFFYGGYGVFDGMKPFMLANGYEEFIEQPDYPKDAFRTVWGVADEYIFDALLARERLAAEKGERFFGTVMTVSNHRPYAVPERPTGRSRKGRNRDGAVAYADWALGRYLDQARQAGLLDHTVVLMAGDHGPRVYGSQQIPAPSYRIPALLLAPDPAWRGRRIDRLCSQVDLAPTLLSVDGIAYEAPFFGEDLSELPPDGGRAFLIHNRDVGLLTDDTLVALGLRKSVTAYTRAGKESDELNPVPSASITPRMRELALDAAAIYQTAYELYQNRRFRLPEPPRASSRSAVGR